MERHSNNADVIVIGSGMGGMTAAAALSKVGRKVLLLEQAPFIGGLTHSFSREGFTWDVGLHYCGTFGRDQPAGKILDWLSNTSIEFSSLGPVYDTLHFPGGFEIAVSRPAASYKMDLKERFPGHEGEIDVYFAALQSAAAAARVVATERGLPEPIKAMHRWWNERTIERWCGRTTGEVISDITKDVRLQAVLSAQWGDYGGRPKDASFAIHAMIMDHYLDGAGYPVGGAKVIAERLLPTIEKAGGAAKSGVTVTSIIVEDSKAVGVRTSGGDEYRAPVIVSAAGARDTAARLLPGSLPGQWRDELRSFEPSVCHWALYLGFEGDIARHGATKANHWFYESWDTNDAIWSDPVGSTEPPMMFVSFASLKDPVHQSGRRNRHTGELLCWADWRTIAPFAERPAAERGETWATLKGAVTEKMLAYFKRKFPGLAPFVVYHELGTPLATAAFTRHDQGAIYGIETTPRRMLSDALSARTPIQGLHLAGQDVCTPGIAGALWGGLIGAASVDLRIFQHFPKY